MTWSFHFVKRIVGYTMLACLAVSLVWLIHFDTKDFSIGFDFSPTRARDYHLDPHAIFLAALRDYHPAVIRLPLEWKDVEPRHGEFNFDEIDWYLKTAGQYNTPVVVAFGRHVPDSAACAAPDWAMKADIVEREIGLRNFFVVTVGHLKSNETVAGWEVEDQPFQEIDSCGFTDTALVTREIDVLRKRDTRPVFLSVGSSFVEWNKAAKLADTYFLHIDSTRVPPLYYQLLLHVHHADTSKAAAAVVSAGTRSADILTQTSYVRSLGFKSVLLTDIERWYERDAAGDGSWLHAAHAVFEAL